MVQGRSSGEIGTPELGRSTTPDVLLVFAKPGGAACRHLAPVRKIPIDRNNAFLPHSAAIVIVEENRALQEILVVAVDCAADVTVGVRPLSGLDIDPSADETNRRAPFVDFDQRSFGDLKIDLLAWPPPSRRGGPPRAPRRRGLSPPGRRPP